MDDTNQVSLLNGDQGQNTNNQKIDNRKRILILSSSFIPAAMSSAMYWYSNEAIGKRYASYTNNAVAKSFLLYAFRVGGVPTNFLFNYGVFLRIAIKIMIKNTSHKNWGSKALFSFACLFIGGATTMPMWWQGDESSRSTMDRILNDASGVTNVIVNAYGGSSLWDYALKLKKEKTLCSPALETGKNLSTKVGIHAARFLFLIFLIIPSIVQNIGFSVSAYDGAQDLLHSMVASIIFILLNLIPSLGYTIEGMADLNSKFNTMVNRCTANTDDDTSVTPTSHSCYCIGTGLTTALVASLALGSGGTADQASYEAAKQLDFGNTTAIIAGGIANVGAAIIYNLVQAMICIKVLLDLIVHGRVPTDNKAGHKEEEGNYGADSKPPRSPEYV